MLHSGRSTPLPAKRNGKESSHPTLRTWMCVKEDARRERASLPGPRSRWRLSGGMRTGRVVSTTEHDGPNDGGPYPELRVLRVKNFPVPSGGAGALAQLVPVSYESSSNTRFEIEQSEIPVAEFFFDERSKDPERSAGHAAGPDYTCPTCDRPLSADTDSDWICSSAQCSVTTVDEDGGRR